MTDLFKVDPYEVALLVFGLAMMAAAWVPQAIYGRHLTLPLIPLAMGALLFWLYDGVEAPNPLTEEGRLVWEKLTEAVVIISLIGAGLKLDRSEWRAWKPTWRLLVLAMPLTIVGVALMGWGLMGLGLAGALLLGAVLAPTDPVLAGDVQVPGPGEGDRHPVRFTLTAEAGLNDGLAFPFVYFAITAASFGALGWDWILEWAWQDLVYRIVAGVVIGYVIGRILAFLIYRVPSKAPVAKAGQGCIALCIFLVAYGGSELLGGYGFLACFVAAFVIRRTAYDSDYNGVLFEFVEDLERAALVLVLVLLGGVALEVMNALTWTAVLSVLVLLFVLRPIVGFLSLKGCSDNAREHWVVGFFGIRGIGSLYYLAYATGHEDFGRAELLWATVTFAVIVSACIHSLSAAPVMAWIERSGTEKRDGKA